jgi:CRISPR-associated protein Cmr1
MKTLTVKLRTVTPLFLGGASPDRCELRPPSIKGALRFWFRFIEGARQNGDWRKVREKERRLFGSTDTGVSALRIKLTSVPRVTQVSRIPAEYREWPIEIAYMGYGPIELRRFTKPEREARQAAGMPTTVFEPKREFIDAGEEFGFDLIFQSSASIEDTQHVYEALWMWTHLGGFGSRARRGWGSLKLEGPAGLNPAPLAEADSKKLKAKLEAGVSGILAGSPLPQEARYSHWFASGAIYCSAEAYNWQGAMKWIGGKLIAYRSNWKRKKGPKPCFADHGLIQDYLKPPPTGGEPKIAPMRAAFGLPHNYTFGGLRDAGWNPYQASVTARVLRGDRHEGLDRRASPIFVRIHGLDHGKVAVLITVIPSDLLPKDGKSEIQVEPTYDDKRFPTRSYEPAIVHVPPPDYAAIYGFLNSL